MIIKKIQNFLFGTLRGRLIISVALVHAIMMTLFIVDLTFRHRAMVLNQQLEEAEALTQTLSTSAAGWIAANDVAGLQELVDAQIRYPEVLFAILTEKNGLILAHTDRSKTGKFLLDLPKDEQLTIMNKSSDLVDVINPVILSGKYIGWARIGLGQKVSDKKLQSIINDGILYALIAVLAGSLIAWIMGRRITRRLYAVQDTMNLISAGDHSARTELSGTDEPALLASEFNAMLDELDESGARFKKLFNAASVPLCFANNEGVIGEYNHRFEQTFGYTHEEIPTIDEWWQLAYPDPEYRQKVITQWQLAVKTASDHNTSIEPSEYMLTCKNGVVRTMLISGSLIGDSILASFIDITERKQAEDALRKSELKYRQLIESLNEGIWMIDEKAVTTFANPIMAEMLGYTVEEMLGRHLFSFMDEQGTQIASRNLERRQQGIRENHEFEFIRKDGTRIYTSLETGPVTDVDDNYRGSVAGVIDITRRRQTEVALRESELKYRSLIEASSDAIFCVDEKGQYQFTNQLFASTFGQSPDYFIGKTFWDIYPKEHADYRFETTKRVFQTGNRESIEVEVPLPDKSLFFYATANPIKDETGKVLLVLTNAVNITDIKNAEAALRKSEERFKALADTSPLAIYASVGVEQKATYINPTFVKLFGYILEEVPSVTQWWPLAYPEENYRRQVVEEWQHSVLKAIETHSETEPMETVVNCKDGSQKNILWGFKTLGEENWTFGLDLTERKKSEERIINQLDELRRWQEVTLGREERVQEMKREVNELCRRLGEPISYPSQESE